MGHVSVNYQMTTDGAPLSVRKVRDGDWVVYCRCCAFHSVEPSLKAAHDLAAAHTYISESSGGCPSWRAAHLRHTHHWRYGFYHKPATNWRHANH